VSPGESNLKSIGNELDSITFHCQIGFLANHDKLLAIARYSKSSLKVAWSGPSILTVGIIEVFNGLEVTASVNPMDVTHIKNANKMVFMYFINLSESIYYSLKYLS
jgi:hypothetical protein